MYPAAFKVAVIALNAKHKIAGFFGHLKKIGSIQFYTQNSQPVADLARIAHPKIFCVDGGNGLVKVIFWVFMETDGMLVAVYDSITQSGGYTLGAAQAKNVVTTLPPVEASSGIFVAGFDYIIQVNSYCPAVDGENTWLEFSDDGTKRSFPN